jgi:hypothetical protein
MFKRHIEIVQLLLKANAKTDVQDLHGYTCLMLGNIFYDSFKYLHCLILKSIQIWKCRIY